MKKKKKMITKDYDLVLVPRHVIVIKHPNIVELAKKYTEINGDTLSFTEEDECSDAMVIRAREKKTKNVVYLVVLFIGTDLVSCAAHEATHVWKMIKNELGIYVNIDAQECDAYPIGEITKRIYDTWKMK